MKNKVIIAILTAGMVICKVSAAQSSLGTTNTEASKPIIIDGFKFPMTASEYNAAKKLYLQKKATEEEALKKNKESADMVISREDNSLSGNGTATKELNPNVTPAINEKSQIQLPDNENDFIRARQKMQQSSAPPSGKVATPENKSEVPAVKTEELQLTHPNAAPFPQGAAPAKPAETPQTVHIKGTSVDPNAKPVQVAPHSKSKNEGEDSPNSVESKKGKAPAEVKEITANNHTVPAGSKQDLDIKPAVSIKQNAPVTLPSGNTAPKKETRPVEKPKKVSSNRTISQR